MEEITLFFVMVTVLVMIMTIAFVLMRYQDRTPDPDTLEWGDFMATLKLSTVPEWFLTIGFTSLFIIAGFHVATGTSAVQSIEVAFLESSNWLMAENFRLFVSGSQIVAGILLIPPQTATWAAIYLASLMSGAIVIHLFIGSWGLAILPLLLLFGLLFLAMSRAPWALGLQRKFRHGEELQA